MKNQQKIKEEDVLKTYEEWKILNRYLAKGSKSIKLNEKGIPLFSYYDTYKVCKKKNDKLPK